MLRAPPFKKKSGAYFGFDVRDVRVIRVLTIDAQLDHRQMERIQTEIFTNPITEASGLHAHGSGFRLADLGGISSWGAGYGGEAPPVKPLRTF